MLCLFAPVCHRRLALGGWGDIVTGGTGDTTERETRIEFGTINGETRCTWLDIHTLLTLSTRRSARRTSDT